jgi:hypothetical protein
MCNGRRGIAEQNVVKPQMANDLAIDISNAGFTLVAACGVNQVMQMVGLGKLKKTYQATEAIKSAKFTLSLVRTDGQEHVVKDTATAAWTTACLIRVRGQTLGAMPRSRTGQS